jgi:hypothetical protein
MSAVAAVTVAKRMVRSGDAVSLSVQDSAVRALRFSEHGEGTVNHQSPRARSKT